MIKELQTVFAGFGGQGILFAGKVMAYAGMMEGRELSWLPSYGPEMRGGTANCSVCLSEKAIGSPLIVHPDALVVMNRPSLEKFEDSVTPGGVIIVDSTMVDAPVTRTDVDVYRIPASELADKKGLSGLANMILLGALYHVRQFCTKEHLEEGLKKCIPARKAHLAEGNRTALQLGYSLV